jgi:cellulose synthase/poly-beta-1,6-N-acetylglucosamine synthase-like glycosyltransferase
MTELATQVVLLVYYLILGVLALYGGHRIHLLVLYYRTRRHLPRTPQDPDPWPLVTVQLPLFNEMYVAERLIRAVCGFDYPRDRLEIQVLDDSNDETAAIVREAVRRFRQRGFRIEHLHRTDRIGFKAGALAAGLERATGELIAVFDADFVPEHDYLRRVVPYFQDPKIGMVQACWDHINRDYSLLTRIQAVFLDGHFLIEHAARNRAGRFFNFNGTAGVWRRQAIVEAGGWQHDTLTEDLDLSYRAQLAGWRFLFLPHVKVPAELPVEVNAFKRQQFRWAKGAIQTARKLLPRILTAPIPWWVKLEALVHLGSNSSYLLMVALSLLIFPAMVLRRGSPISTILLIDLPLFLCATVSVLVFYYSSQIIGKRNRAAGLKQLMPLMGLGIGLAVNNSRAVLEGLKKEVGVFERTPKYRIENRGDRWQTKRYRAGSNLWVVLEGVLALWFAIACGLAWRMGMWLSLPFLYLFLQGYSYIYLLSLVSASRSARRWGARAHTVAGADTTLSP